MRRELGAVTKSGKTIGGQVFLQWRPRHDHIIMSVCLAPKHSQLGISLAESLAWQTDLPDTMADSASLLNQAHTQYQSGTGGITVEKPAETQPIIWLASHLVRALNSRSGGREFKYPMRRELGALTKSGKTVGIRSFYNMKKYY